MTKKEAIYPDVSDILEEKAEMRRRLAKRSFEEKVDAMEALRERLKPFKEARERRKAEGLGQITRGHEGHQGGTKDTETS